MEHHPWLPRSKYIKGLKGKKVCSISTVTNDSDILAELMSLMTSDLTSIKKTNLQNSKQQQVGEGRKSTHNAHWFFLKT